MISKREALVKDRILKYLEKHHLVDFFNVPEEEANKAKTSAIEGELNIDDSKLNANYEEIFVFANDMVREHYLTSNKSNGNNINQSYFLTSKGLYFVKNGAYRRQRKIEIRRWTGRLIIKAAAIFFPIILGGAITIYGRYFFLKEPTGSELQQQLNSLQSQLDSLKKVQNNSLTIASPDPTDSVAINSTTNQLVTDSIRVREVESDEK